MAPVTMDNRAGIPGTKETERRRVAYSVLRNRLARGRGTCPDARGLSEEDEERRAEVEEEMGVPRVPAVVRGSLRRILDP